jgi:hypothetical protein
MKNFNINIQKIIQLIFKCHYENIYVSIEFIIR